MTQGCAEIDITPITIVVLLILIYIVWWLSRDKGPKPGYARASIPGMPDVPLPPEDD